MCGIIAVAHPQWPAESWRPVLSDMAACLAHRGPDDEGLWFDAAAGFGLAHRRLAILDTSSRGRQPMAGRDGRFHLVHNGEIYNFLSLRRELAALGHSFTTETDTEVMLAAFLEWGIEEALGRFNGMFAFVLWDAQQRRIHLARDRMGEKPLYYGRVGHGWIASSELGVLDAHPEFVAEVDRDQLSLFLRYNCVPAPGSIYRGIAKVLPGEWVTVALDGGRAGEPVRRRYWSLQRVAAEGVRQPLTISDAEAVELLDGELRRAVRLRMVSDVPLGAFLSGGIDSSTVVALMQAQSTSPVKTFTIGFEVEGFDEATYAHAVAEHLGTEHHELYVTAAQAREVIPKLPVLYDEPFSDSSQIPTFLVSELARRTVTVSLSGDGGDECFAGYKRYALARKLWRRLRRLPLPVRRGGAAALRVAPLGLLDGAFGWAEGWLASYGRRGRAGDKLRKLAEVLEYTDRLDLYHHLMTHWRRPDEVVVGAGGAPGIFADAGAEAFTDFGDAMMYLDMASYLPDDILVKLDRASMGVSLESRVPLLDPHLVELAWRLPRRLKERDGEGKWVLRQVLARYVPSHLFERPKMGFGVPLAAWLRGPLRPWAEELLSEDRLRREGYFEPVPIRRLWLDHVSGRRDWHGRLWDVLMFQAWVEARSARVAAPHRRTA